MEEQENEENRANKGWKRFLKPVAITAFLASALVLGIYSFRPRPEIKRANTPELGRRVSEAESFLGMEKGLVKRITDKSEEIPANLIEIDTLDELNDIGEIQGYPLDGDYKLTANIDCKGERLEQIGEKDKPKKGDPFTRIKDTPFSGTFNGSGYTISNFTLGDPKENEVALFYRLSKDGLISNLKFENATVSGDEFVSLLVNENDYGDIFKCSIKSSSIRANFRGAGLVSINYGNILNCNSDKSTSVKVRDVKSGGLVVGNLGRIVRSYTEGPVSGGSEVGGVAASTSKKGVIYDSYSTGPIRGRMKIGGTAGSSEDSTFIDCKENSDVKFKKGRNNEDKGTLIGFASDTLILGNKWDKVRDLVGGVRDGSVAHYPNVREHYKH